LRSLYHFWPYGRQEEQEEKKKVIGEIVIEEEEAGRPGCRILDQTRCL
jgi:hypothetical protein